ncbi:class I SAM-dependent methyltransferase [Desulfocastanea catecholica]
MITATSKLFEHSPCVCCGQQNHLIRYPIDQEYASNISGIDIKEVKIGITECSHCGHLYIQPVPQTTFLSGFYAGYMSKAKSGFYKERSANIEIPEKFCKKYTHWLLKLREIDINLHSVLDVGAGLGMFLRLAKRHGFEVLGVEPNKEAALALKEKYGISVINSLFEDVETDQRVDVITMWDLLEHLADPAKALLKAHDLLNPNGILILEIPARDSLLHDLSKFLYRFSVGRIRRPLYIVCGVHHLHYFSEKHICNLLRESGYEIEKLFRGETDLHALYRGKRGKRSLQAIVFNITLSVIFWLAKVVGRQNKLVIFAKKISSQ